MLKDHSHAIEILSNCLPYFNQAKNFDFSKPDKLSLAWRGATFSITLSTVSVMEIDGGLLSGTMASMLLERLIKICLNPITYTPLPY